MESPELQQFCRQNERRLTGAVIRRIRCTRSGLVLECQGATGPFEWSVLGCRKVVVSLVLQPGERQRLLQEAAARRGVLASPTPPGLFAHGVSATLLDAVRLWLLQPAARPPEWKLLEGCEIERLEQPEHERILLLALRAQTSMGESRLLHLQIELFSRGLNLILRDSEASEIANWAGRAAATARAAKLPAPAVTDRTSTDDALDVWMQLADACAVDLLQESRRVARRERRRLQQLVGGLERDLATAEQAAEWRKKGELLSANLHRVRKGQAKVELADWTANDALIELELDPTISPQENVTRFFKRAKRGERGHETIAARLESARRELQAVTAADESDDAPDLMAALVEAQNIWKQALDKDADAGVLAKLWQPGGPPWQVETPKPAASGKRRAQTQKEAKPAHPGRRFVLQGKWEVFVGRSNAENDELTHRFAHPQDVWLHAGGVPGSHVVLRMHGSTDNPPRDILEQAAAIAARFSKAKHAGTVPVIWTRKRYVRKPRGSKAGLAVCTQEKTVFVKPGIPEEDA